jgi:hypothetical protein
VIRVLSFFCSSSCWASLHWPSHRAGTPPHTPDWVGTSVFLVGLLVLVARRYLGDYLVNALTSSPDSEKPVSAVWAIETNLLPNVGINALIYGGLVILAAWIAGPARAAASLRRWLAPTMRDRPFVIYGFVALVLLIVLLTGPTDAQRISRPDRVRSRLRGHRGPAPADSA